MDVTQRQNRNGHGEQQAVSKVAACVWRQWQFLEVSPLVFRCLPHQWHIQKYTHIPNLCPTVYILTVTLFAPFHLVITLVAHAHLLILCGSQWVPVPYAVLNFTGMVQMLWSRDSWHLKRSFIWVGLDWQVGCLHHHYLLSWQSMCHPHILPAVILCIIREH